MSTDETNSVAYFTDLAKKNNLQYISLREIPLNIFSLEKNKNIDYLRLQAIPILRTPDKLRIATSNPSPKNIHNIKEFWKVTNNQTIEILVTPRQDISYVLSSLFSEEFIYESGHIRDIFDYKHSASYTFSLSEKIVIVVVLVFLLYALAKNFFVTSIWIELFLAMGTTIIVAFKMGLSIRAIKYLYKKRFTEFTLDEKQLPVYTILIPLLREKKETISILLSSLEKLDYPKELLDVKFLLEEDDVTTGEVMKEFVLPWYYQVVVVPPGKPRSKPHACNYGMQLAFGEYLTIYDAEDCPDPDQLKIVLQHFHDNPPQVACIQAALNFYNHDENLLTRLFTIEYTHWFDSMIPALSTLRVPVPLGGTSNHFKMDVLRKIGGWDPYIGTEDAEIGVRLYRQGYRVGTTRSTTYEEANTRLINWFFQRTRWVKGYMQTYLTNMRDPLHMIKQIGIRGFLGFQYFVGGNVFIKLANLPLWIYMIGSFVIPRSYFAEYHLELVYTITWYNFIISNLILLSCEFIAVYKRGLYSLLPYVPLKLFYWMLMSVSGYYAIFELLVRPGFWYKTEHGLTKKSK